jgi:hypothetical protein
MFYGRFKNICLPNTDQDVCILNDITYLHEMSSHPYRSRFLQLRLDNRKHAGIQYLHLAVHG